MPGVRMEGKCAATPIAEPLHLDSTSPLLPPPPVPPPLHPSSPSSRSTKAALRSSTAIKSSMARARPLHGQRFAVLPPPLPITSASDPCSSVATGARTGERRGKRSSGNHCSAPRPQQAGEGRREQGRQARPRSWNRRARPRAGEEKLTPRWARVAAKTRGHPIPAPPPCMGQLLLKRLGRHRLASPRLAA
jgi:hypothetical protein